jgi:hypothetical protein
MLELLSRLNQLSHFFQLTNISYFVSYCLYQALVRGSLFNLVRFWCENLVFNSFALRKAYIKFHEQHNCVIHDLFLIIFYYTYFFIVKSLYDW